MYYTTENGMLKLHKEDIPQQKAEPVPIVPQKHKQYDDPRDRQWYENSLIYGREVD